MAQLGTGSRQGLRPLQATEIFTDCSSPETNGFTDLGPSIRLPILGQNFIKVDFDG